MNRRRKYRGFATLGAEHAKACAAKAGKAAHESGRAHVWTRDEAQAAGRLGGLAAAERRREMAELARAERDAERDYEDERKREIAGRTQKKADDDAA